MDFDKQALLVGHLLSDQTLFATCHGMVRPSYFEPSLKKVIAFAQDFFEKYKQIPTQEILKAETGFKFTEGMQIGASKSEQKYVADQLEVFCKQKAIEEAIFAAPQMLYEGDYGLIESTLKEAISVGLNRNLGTDYFANPELRLRQLIDSTNFIPTGWRDVDEILGGGVGRQELLLFGANSGVGKSIAMLNLSINLLAQGLNGVYFTLELAEGVVSKRADSMLTGIGQVDVFKNISRIANELEASKDLMGKFYIKRFPESSTNANTIRAYLKEFEQVNGFTPDFIVIDYLDLMTTNSKISAENLFVKDKYVAEEARALGHDFNCLVISASQLGRAALEAEHVHQGHIQGGISKVNTADNFIAIIQSDQMRATGEYVFEFAKTRNSNGVGKKVILRWDPISLRITDLAQAPLVNGKKSDKGAKAPNTGKNNSYSMNSAGTVFDKIKSSNALSGVIDMIDQP